MASLIDGAGDFRLRSADEALGVLFPQPEQISLDDERASFIAFCARYIQEKVIGFWIFGGHQGPRRRRGAGWQ